MHRRIASMGASFFVAALAILVAYACSSSTSKDTVVSPCGAGEVESCTTATGCTGTKTCGADGTFGACVCEDAGAGGAAGADAMPACGDGVVNQPSEQCDDRNSAACDGCEACQRRRYLAFDGATARVEISDVTGAPLQLVGTPLTIEAWFRLLSVEERLHVQKRGSLNRGWALGLQADVVAATLYGHFDHYYAGTFGDGVWHHVAWTYDSAESRLFLDGRLVSTESHADAVEASLDPITIGARRDNTGLITYYDPGSIDELRISTSIRYTADFSPARAHEADAVTVGLWHFDEGAGSTVIDSSASAHPGSVIGGVDWLNDDGYGDLLCP